MDILDKQPELDSGLVKCSAKFLNAQLLLKEKEYQQAEIVLKEIADTFKSEEEHDKVLECKLLLAECKAYETNKI
jgi:outer membrane PBP1 activator LpoA protein